MSGWIAGYRRLLAYFDSPDPRLGIAGTVALIVTGNLPFFPAYVWWIAGAKAWFACLAWLTLPAFAAAPALARRDPRAGKTLLMAASLANTALCALALGRASAVELFYLPCLALAGLIETGRARLASLVATAGAIAGLLVAIGNDGLAGLTSEESLRLARLDAASVAALMAVMAFSAYRRLRRAAASG